MQLVILVCAQNVVRSLSIKTLYIAPPALLPSAEAEADSEVTLTTLCLSGVYSAPIPLAPQPHVMAAPTQGASPPRSGMLPGFSTSTRPNNNPDHSL